MDVISDFSLAKTFFVITLLAAASFDIASYRIPNAIIAVLLLGFAIVALAGGADVDWPGHLIAGVGSFAVCVLFYAMGKMGAGDVKLLGTIALWGGTGSLLSLIFWISAAALLVVIVLLILRTLIPLLRTLHIVPVAGSLPRVLVPGEGVPYGVPIFVGTLIALAEFPPWLWAY